ncbi:MAG: hypothetical protein ACM3VX_01340 [Bacteroidota bacterium]
MYRLKFIALIALVLLLSGAALAAPINLSGSVETTIEYTNEDKWTGQTHVVIGADAGPAGLWIGLRWYDTTNKFWEGYPQLSPFTPYAISVTASGPLWNGGPAFTRTFGDLRITGPAYIAGQTDPAATRGVLIKDLKIGHVELSGYFAWPKYRTAPLDPGPTTISYGGALRLPGWHGFDLSLYHNTRRGSFTAGSLGIEVPDGSTASIAALDPTPDFDTLVQYANKLVLYTRESVNKGPIGLSLYWTFAELAADGTVLRVLPGVEEIYAPSETTDYAYLLAGHESMAAWLQEHLSPLAGTGARVTFVDRETGSPIVPGDATVGFTERVTAVEAATRWFGVDVKGSVGLQTLDYGSAGRDAYRFKTATFSKTLGSAGEIVATPLALAVTYRNIDGGFLPWAGLRSEDDNPIYAWRNRQGWAVTGNLALFPQRPVNIHFEHDQYVEKSTNIPRSRSSLTLNNVIKTQFGPIQRVVPSFAVEFPVSGTAAKTFKIDTMMSIGQFRDVRAAWIYAVKGTEGITSLEASYTDPTGLVFSVKRSSVDDPASRDDNYVKVTYTRTF